MEYVKQSDKRGTYIIEGERKNGNTFVIKRFICTVHRGQTEEETEDVADMLVIAMNRTYEKK